MSQVIVNLVLNSRDALQNGGNVLCAAEKSESRYFSFGVVPAGQFAHVRVGDTGPGMPPDVLQHVFEPLFTTKRTETGSVLRSLIRSSWPIEDSSSPKAPSGKGQISTSFCRRCLR